MDVSTNGINATTEIVLDDIPPVTHPITNAHKNANNITVKVLPANIASLTTRYNTANPKNSAQNPKPVSESVQTIIAYVHNPSPFKGNKRNTIHCFPWYYKQMQLQHNLYFVTLKVREKSSKETKPQHLQRNVKL